MLAILAILVSAAEPLNWAQPGLGHLIPSGAWLDPLSASSCAHRFTS